MPPGRQSLPRLLLALLPLALLAACAAHDIEGRPVDVGTSREGYLKGGLYHNDFFQFTWKAPAGWTAVKPTALEVLVTRPDPNQGYMFGWANPALKAEVRFVVHGPGQVVPPNCALPACAAAVARANMWRPVNEQAGQWQGKPVVESFYAAPTGPGQAPAGIMARYVRLGQDLLVFQLQVPNANYNQAREVFQGVMRELAFQRSPEELAREAARQAAAAEMVHVVKGPGETVAIIAQWYTGSAENTQRIMNHNRLPASAPLAVGLQIRIPGELVTNRQAMPAPPPPPAKKKAAPVKGEPRRAEAAPLPAAAPPEEPAAPEARPAAAPPTDAGGEDLILEPIGPR